MKFLDEYRNRELGLRLAEQIRREATKQWVIMEVCGGQTHSIVRYGLDELLGDSIELLHGPGCPVCVTPLEMIDRAHRIASQPGVIFCSFGDMLRVPGSDGDLFTRRAQGADVRIVYSPLDAVGLAERHPDRQVVFFAIGFETTAPANAMAAREARRRGLSNFSLLVSHVLVPPALVSILESPGCRIQGFLGPGHVCTVMGVEEYEPIVEKYRVPIVVTGFEPIDLLEGILRTVRLLEASTPRVELQYGRAASRAGNLASRSLVDDVFQVSDRNWRGVGAIPESGYRLSADYEEFDAERRFGVADLEAPEPEECISGEILRGLKKPVDCPAFGERCTPDQPLGATMVSAEGACSAYFAYGRTPRHRLPLVAEVGP